MSTQIGNALQEEEKKLIAISYQKETFGAESVYKLRTFLFWCCALFSKHLCTICGFCWKLEAT